MPKGLGSSCLGLVAPAGVKQHGDSRFSASRSRPRRALAYAIFFLADVLSGKKHHFSSPDKRHFCVFDLKDHYISTGRKRESISITVSKSKVRFFGFSSLFWGRAHSSSRTPGNPKISATAVFRGLSSEITSRKNLVHLF